MGDPDRKVLVAGVGNVLKGDDGFGIALAHRLMLRTDLPAAVKVIETGIGGMSLVQELMYGYDALVIADAYRKGGAPGTLYLLAPELPDLSGLDLHQLRDYFSDTHYATPMRALSLIERIGKLPPVVRILGCEPAQTEEMALGLSDSVVAAVEEAIGMLEDWLARYYRDPAVEGDTHSPSPQNGMNTPPCTVTRALGDTPTVTGVPKVNAVSSKRRSG